MTPAKAGAIPKIVLGTHLNLLVQGKVSIRHLRVMLINSSPLCDPI